VKTHFLREVPKWRTGDLEIKPTTRCELTAVCDKRKSEPARNGKGGEETFSNEPIRGREPRRHRHSLQDEKVHAGVWQKKKKEGLGKTKYKEQPGYCRESIKGQCTEVKDVSRKRYLRRKEGEEGMNGAGRISKKKNERGRSFITIRRNRLRQRGHGRGGGPCRGIDSIKARN